MRPHSLAENSLIACPRRHAWRPAPASLGWIGDEQRERSAGQQLSAAALRVTAGSARTRRRWRGRLRLGSCRLGGRAAPAGRSLAVEFGSELRERGVNVLAIGHARSIAGGLSRRRLDAPRQEISVRRVRATLAQGADRPARQLRLDQRTLQRHPRPAAIATCPLRARPPHARRASATTAASAIRVGHQVRTSSRMVNRRRGRETARAPANRSTRRNGRRPGRTT